MLKKLDLTEGSLCENLFTKDICDLLDGDSFLCLQIVRGTAKAS